MILDLIWACSTASRDGYNYKVKRLSVAQVTGFFIWWRDRTVFISLSKSKNDSLVFNYSGCTVYHDVNQWYHVNDTDQFALTLASINLISSWSQSIYYLIYHNPPLKIVESTTLTSTKQSLRQQITIIFKQTRIPVKNKYKLTIIPV